MVPPSRAPLMLIAALVLNGCAVTFGVETEGTLTVELGAFNDTCDLPNTVYPIEEGGSCAVSHELLADNTTCRITSVCTDVSLIDTEAISAEIEDSTGGNDRAKTEIIAMSVFLDDLVFSGGSATLDDFNLQMDAVKDQPPIPIMRIDLQDAETLQQGETVEAFTADDPADPLLRQLNTSIAAAEGMPTEILTVIDVPLAEVLDRFIRQNEVTAEVDYLIQSEGSGSVCLFGCGD